MKMIFSMSLTGAFLLIFGITIGVATFIENDFGAATAQAVVYKALWFEILLGLMAANMIGVIFKLKLYRREKWGNLLFHVAFLITLLGAAITRFTGQEGLMHIREGQAAHSFLTDETYLSGTVLNGNEKAEFSKKVLYVPIKKASFSRDVEVGDKEVSIELLHFIYGAREEVQTNQQTGKPIVTVVATRPGGGRKNIFLQQGELVNLGKTVIGFDASEPVTVNILLTDEGLKFQSKVSVNTFSMDTQAQGIIAADSLAGAPFRHLLTANGENFVLSAFNPVGQVTLVPSPASNKNTGLDDALVFLLKSNGEEKEIVVKGGKGRAGVPQFVNVGGLDVMLAFGAKEIEVPFSVYLQDFQLDRYPGSDSPSSYASEVTVKDGESEFPFRIYMNHILSHKGYRLYQSSYDRDELGTVLSINKDKPGTVVSYLGYLLLAIGLISIVFNKNTRFSKVSKKIDKVHAKRASLASVIVLLLLSYSGFAQHNHSFNEFMPTKEMGDDFSRLIYQSSDGRMAPLNSLANDIVRKVHQKDKYMDLTPNQVLLGMMTSPFKWQDEPIIKVTNQEIRNILGIIGKYARYKDFFNQDGYILSNAINAAYEKRPAERSQFDKDLMKVDERLNILYLVFRGDLLRVFPVPNDPNNKWVSPTEEHLPDLNQGDSIFIRSALSHYMRYLIQNEQDSANFILDGIKRYQKTYGAAVIPSEAKINIEIAFYSLNIFERLFPFYMLAGFFLLIVNFIKIYRVKAKLKYLVMIGNGFVLLGFVTHLTGLILRWYISGHEPWSNGYESMIYIAWATVLAGIIFSRKSEMTLAVTAILAGIILFVAHLSFMDPEITNLVPVLKSYWLTIHVATIVASYGFFGLGALLGFVNLVSYLLKRKSNKVRIDLSIKEVTYVIEMTLTIGLIMLTIGNFLGGVWANESWGRYWGWDPKETWAMASIIFYAFVLHMRFIPGLKGRYTFNLMAVIMFSSILMTYFGVNYYLSGLHSYAAGDPVPIPTFVYYTLATVALVAAGAYYNNKRLTTVDAKKNKN